MGGPGESRHSEVGAVVDGQDGRGEELVVAAGEALGPLRVLPHPCREPFGEGFLLVAGGEGLGVIAHSTSVIGGIGDGVRSEEHTSELQSLMRLSYAVFCLKKKTDIEAPADCTLQA